MTDKDVMESFFNTIQLGKLYGPYTPKEKKVNGENRKDFWIWHCYEPLQVYSFLKMLIPYLGKRRTTKALEAFNHLNEIIN